MYPSDFKAKKLNQVQLEQIADFEIQFYVLASRIKTELPSSAHQTAALRKLLEAKMTTIHAISHGIVQANSAISATEGDGNAPCNSAFESGVKEF